MDIPRIFNITESAHRIHNPITPEKLATLGAALRLETGTRVLDLGSGSGEMLCTWARDYGVIGTGIDMSQLFTEQAKLRAETLDVTDQVEFRPTDVRHNYKPEWWPLEKADGLAWPEQQKLVNEKRTLIKQLIKAEALHREEIVC